MSLKHIFRKTYLLVFFSTLVHKTKLLECLDPWTASSIWAPFSSIFRITVTLLVASLIDFLLMWSNPFGRQLPLVTLVDSHCCVIFILCFYKGCYGAWGVQNFYTKQWLITFHNSPCFVFFYFDSFLVFIMLCIEVYGRRIKNRSIYIKITSQFKCTEVDSIQIIMWLLMVTGCPWSTILLTLQ